MNNKFSENLKKIRKDNNLSQEQLADELGVSRQAISKWESSVAYPEMDKIITLCEKFNLKLDDLLHKDIREIKSEEESKKNINKYLDDFLNFITNTINMFCAMKFKSKIKCLFEQVLIAGSLFIIFFIIAMLCQDLLSAIFGIMPDKVYFFVHSMLRFLYWAFAILCSTIIMVHIFKTRYLNYYDDQKEETISKDDFNQDSKTLNEKDYGKKERIIIRDPKHSEYKFINALLKCIIGIVKFFTLCALLVLFALLVGFFASFVLSFLIIKTGVFFIGIVSTILSISIINIILILLLLNFVFNRKNDKKKIIWTFIISLITLGIGIGLSLVSFLGFKYESNSPDNLKTEYIELDMNEELVLDFYQNISYIESNNSNVKIEYTINKDCNINYYYISQNHLHLDSNCDNPIDIIKSVLNDFNNKKITNVNNEVLDIKVYSTKDNINKLKDNYTNYISAENEIQNTINYYEKQVNELEQKLNEYSLKEEYYLEQINTLQDQVTYYKNNEQ